MVMMMFGGFTSRLAIFQTTTGTFVLPMMESIWVKMTEPNQLQHSRGIEPRPELYGFKAHGQRYRHFKCIHHAFDVLNVSSEKLGAVGCTDSPAPSQLHSEC